MTSRDVSRAGFDGYENVDMTEFAEWRECAWVPNDSVAYVRRYVRYPAIVHDAPCYGVRARFYDPESPGDPTTSDAVWALKHETVFVEDDLGKCRLATDPGDDSYVLIIDGIAPGATTSFERE